MTAELPAIDYLALQKRQEYTFWGILAGAILLTLILAYLAYSQVIRPKNQQLARVKSEVVQARNDLQTKTEQKENLPYIKELYSAMEVQWNLGKKWFLPNDYWEVLDRFVPTLVENMALNGVHAGCIENPPWLETAIYRRELVFPHFWTAEKMREYAELHAEALGREEGFRIRIGDRDPELSGANLLNPIGFRAKVCGEYEEIMTFLEHLFYESPIFFGIAQMKFKRAGEVGGFFTVVGTEEEVEITGAAFWLNENGTPNVSFLPEQLGGQILGGGGPVAGPGGPGGPATGM